MKIRDLFYFSFFLFFTIFSSCTSPSSMRVGVGVLPFGELFQEILGPRVSVISIVKDSSSLESNDLSLKVMQEVSKANFYFSFQMPLEKILWEKKFFKTSQWQRLDIVTPPLSFSATTHMLPKREADASIDPHIWMSPKRMIKALEFSLHTLSMTYPEYRKEWEHRYENVKMRLQKLDADITFAASKHPEAFLVFHPFLGYLAKDYHLTQLSLEKEGKETGLRDLIELFPEIRSHHIKVLYVEKGTSRSILDGMKKEFHLKVVEVNPFGKDYENQIRQFLSGLQ